MKKLIIAAMAFLSFTAAGLARTTSNDAVLVNLKTQQVKKPDAKQAAATKTDEKAQVKKSKAHSKRHKKHKKAKKNQKAVKPADMKKKTK